MTGETHCIIMFVFHHRSVIECLPFHQVYEFRPFMCQMVHFSVTLVITYYPETNVYPNLPESIFNFFHRPCVFVSLLCLVLSCS